MKKIFLILTMIFLMTNCSSESNDNYNSNSAPKSGDFGERDFKAGTIFWKELPKK
jgi:hypothetical protein